MTPAALLVTAFDQWQKIPSYYYSHLMLDKKVVVALT